MSVPEAPMYEDRLAEARKHQVGCAWKIAPVQPEPESEAMGDAADD